MRRGAAVLLTIGLLTGPWQTARGGDAGGDATLHLGAAGYASRPADAVSDLDYRSDFSVETLLTIEAHQAGGRWSAAVAKTASVPTPSSGFSLGIEQGHFRTFGQCLYAKVADGTEAATARSAPHQGLTYAVLTWDAKAKTLSLYVNGALAATERAPALRPLAIKNASPLSFGADLGYGQTLGRDLHLVRLWNRRLTPEEVGSVWRQLRSSPRHPLPQDFDRAALLSEWLMEETSDANGGAGVTHVRDNAGGNHLRLLGGATVLSGAGPLVLSDPKDGEAGVSPSAFLRAAGGGGLLGKDATRPVQYWFQVDERDSFDSPSLKESGWLAHAGAWKPVLKPGTTYYWRVRVRGSSERPLEAPYGLCHSFRTRESRNWYVRPGVYSGAYEGYTPVGVPGTYGQEDGSSYQDAWNGLRKIVWGPGGVSAGDNLYVCGTHVYTATSSEFLANQASAVIEESGFSEQLPVTIRMDCEGDKGVLWGIFADRREGPVAWTGPDRNGVFRTTGLRYGAAAQQVDGRLVWLDAEEAPTWEGHRGATFSAAGVTYVKTADGRDPKDTIFSPDWGFRFDLGRSKYVRFYKATFYASNLGKERVDTTKEGGAPSQHVVFEDCTFRYGVVLDLHKGHDYWTIRNSELSDAPYGVYTMLDRGLGDQDTAGANFLQVDGNRIHDLGTPNFPHQDAHAIGIQAGEGHTIQDNTMWNTGTAIEFWTYSQPMRNHVVRYNLIRDVHVKAVSGGVGIAVSGDNVASVPGLRTGFQIYGNVIMNTGLEATEDWQGWGIGSNNKDGMEIYNNTLYNTNGGIALNVVGGPAQGRVFNNIIVDVGEKRYGQVLGSREPWSLEWDYNLYWTHSGSGKGVYLQQAFGHDAHSLIADPKFRAETPDDISDLIPSVDSPAVGSGRATELLRDLLGGAGGDPAGRYLGALQPVPSKISPPQSLRTLE